MSKHINVLLDFSFMVLNHFVTSLVFFHCFSGYLAKIFRLTFSSIFLLIFPSSGLLGVDKSACWFVYIYITSFCVYACVCTCVLHGCVHMWVCMHAFVNVCEGCQKHWFSSIEPYQFKNAFSSVQCIRCRCMIVRE